jgi:hypothetical protein
MRSIAALRFKYIKTSQRKQTEHHFIFLVLGRNAQSFQSSHCFPALFLTRGGALRAGIIYSIEITKPNITPLSREFFKRERQKTNLVYLGFRSGALRAGALVYMSYNKAAFTPVVRHFLVLFYVEEHSRTSNKSHNIPVGAFLCNIAILECYHV